MRKNRIISLIAFFLLTLVFVAGCNENVPGGELQGEEKDGLIYALSDDGASYELAGVKTEAEEYTVASEINGLPVVAIGNSAFYNNVNIKRINLPDSIVKIDAYAFDNCSSLESIALPAAVESIGFNAFSDCTSIREFVMPANLKTIGSDSFARCTALEKLYVNSLLEAIERDAFLGCDALSELHIENINTWCSVSFDNLDANPLSISEKLYVAGELVENLNISGVETINDYAFYEFLGLKTLTLGEGVKTIGNSAFSNCKNLTRVTLSDSVENVGKSAFNTCSALEYIVVGRGIKRFEGLAFYACYSLYGVEVLDLKAWCEAFFYTDNSGTANPLRYADELIIGGRAVKSLIIPEGVQKITTLSFINFSGTSVTLPKTLRKIEDTAFYMCDNLAQLYYRGTADELSLVSIGYNNFSTIERIILIK